MARKKSKKPSKRTVKDSSDSTAIKVLRVIVWPFKMLFIFVSWILKVLVMGIEWLIDSSKKYGKRRKEARNTPNPTERYVQFTTIKSISGNFQRFENVLSNKDSTIGIILGARGSGKSAFGLKLLENLHVLNGRKIFAMGFRSGELPSWIRVIDDIEHIENNSYVLIDEGGILFNARQGFSDANKLLSQLLLIARHKDLSIMFISQNSANLEINAIRQADYLILKPSSLLQMDFERKKIKEIYSEVLEDFTRYSRTKGLTYVYSDAFKGFVSNPLPTFWTQNISKSFSGKNKSE
ncbi:MAG: hypothetical protein ACP5NW_03830 [Candidatus Woesearchaeota archaeon]